MRSRHRARALHEHHVQLIRRLIEACSDVAGRQKKGCGEIIARQNGRGHFPGADVYVVKGNRYPRARVFRATLAGHH